MKGTVSLHEIYKKYHEWVKFLSIYIREAHPLDGWSFARGVMGPVMFKLMGYKAATDVTDPKTLQERRAVAGDCEESLKYGIRTYVDEMDDAVNKAYAAWPTRLYLIGLEGEVVYAGGLGPFGFHPPEFEKAIEEYLSVGVAVALL